MMTIKSFLPILLFSSTLCLLAFDDASGGPSSSSIGVVLEINGTKLTLADMEHKHPFKLFQARNTFYQAESSALDEFASEYLLEQEAQKEHVTVEQLLDQQANAAIPKEEPSEEALRLYYEGIESKEPYEAMRAGILDHIRQSRLLKARAAYVKELRSKANVIVALPPPRALVSLKDTPVRGPENAPVTITEFADYECPYCQQTQSALDKMEAEYKGKVAFAYKDLPLPMHPHAQKAAEAAHCAGVQGKYWEFHDSIFSSKKLEISQLKEAADALKLDTVAFDKCLDSGEQAQAVKAQVTEAQNLQLQGTPSFFINGQFFSGTFAYEQLRTIVDEALKASTTPVAQASKR
jgi:protein-disulfide isomerase